MCFGHPLYFMLSIAMALYFEFLFNDYGHITSSGIIFIFLFMIIFGAIRYIICKKINRSINFYDYSKFYFFTYAFIPFYILLDYGEMGFVALIQIILPIFVCITVIYSIIKIIIIRKYKNMK